MAIVCCKTCGGDIEVSNGSGTFGGKLTARYLTIGNENTSYSDTTHSLYANGNTVYLRNDKTSTSVTLKSGSQTITHSTGVDANEIGVFCETDGTIYSGYDEIGPTDCVCNVRTATNLSKRLIGIVCKLPETSVHEIKREVVSRDGTGNGSTDNGSTNDSSNDSPETEPIYTIPIDNTSAEPTKPETITETITNVIDGEFASHGDVLVRIVPGDYEIGDILTPDENGYGKLATIDDLQYMSLYGLPRVKITSFDTGIDGMVACFIM
jgi:hypothetical protein